MNSNEQDIKRFLDIRRVNDASIKTIKNYDFILRQLNDFLKSKPFREATEQDIFAFLSFKRKSGFSATSLNLYKVVLKGFYRFLYDLPRHQYSDQVKNLNGGNNRRRMPIRPEDVITKEDVAFLIKYCTNFRDEALVVTLYESGCRLGEFLNINVEHLKIDEKGIVLLASGKTGERRIRLIESVPYLQKWLENHPRKDETGKKPLWCSLIKPHQRISADRTQAFFQGLKKRSSFKKPLNPHNFRHSRLTELAKYLSDSKLKTFAGWTANSRMTGVYVHLSGQDIEEDLFKIAGVEIEEEKPKVSPLRVKECERCHTKNPGTAEFCQMCGLPFNQKLLIKDTLETDNLRNEIQGLKEKLKDAGEVTDSMWDVIDNLKKEVKELRSRA